MGFIEGPRKMKKERTSLQTAAMQYGQLFYRIKGIQANIKYLCSELQVDYEGLDESLQELYITLEEANELRAKRKGVVLRK